MIDKKRFRVFATSRNIHTTRARMLSFASLRNEIT